MGGEEISKRNWGEKTIISGNSRSSESERKRELGWKENERFNLSTSYSMKILRYVYPSGVEQTNWRNTKIV